MKDRIKQLRLSQGLTQAEFASALGVSRNTVAIWETVDERAPSAITLNLMCDKYGVNLQWLKTGEGKMYQPVEQSEEIARFMSSLIKPSEDAEKQEKIRSFISSVSQLNYDEWEVLYKIAKSWVDKNEKA